MTVAPTPENIARATEIIGGYDDNIAEEHAALDRAYAAVDEHESRLARLTDHRQAYVDWLADAALSPNDGSLP